jgi:hypothetical protein
MAGVEFVLERDSVRYRRALHLVLSVLSCGGNIELPSLEWERCCLNHPILLE